MSLMLRVPIVDNPQKSNVYGIWSAEGSVCPRRLHSQESYFGVALLTLLKAVQYNQTSLLMNDEKHIAETKYNVLLAGKNKTFS